MTTIGTPAGWYPDPSDPAGLRFWDGARWTANVQPVYRPQQSRRGCGTALAISAFVAVGLLVALGLLGSLVGGGDPDARPDADPELVSFATTLNSDFALGGRVVDASSTLASDSAEVAMVRIEADQGVVLLRRFKSVDGRIQAEAAASDPVAGCGAVLVGFDLTDPALAASHAESTLSTLTFLNGGDCSVIGGPAPPSSKVQSEPRKTFDLARDSCTRDSSGFVEVTGRIRNLSGSTRSYSVDVSIENDAGVRLDTGGDLLLDVKPGETAVWRAMAYAPHSGDFFCNVSASEL